MPTSPPSDDGQPTLWLDAFGGSSFVFIDAPATAGWSATLTPAGAWVKFVSASTGTGPSILQLTADSNTADQRQGTLSVAIANVAPTLVWPIVQTSAVPLALLNEAALAIPPFPPAVPNAMELGIAGKFIAQQIKKIPEPFTLIALLIVEIIVIVLGLLAIALRTALAPLVPEPKTWLGAPEPFSPLTLTLPATTVFLIEETVLLALYILEQTLA
jgi:hypothetical protein